MSIKNRINKLEKLSPENKCHRVGQQDCLVLNGFEPCTAETCKYGCWFTEIEYKAYMKRQGLTVSEWVLDESDTEQA